MPARATDLYAETVDLAVHPVQPTPTPPRRAASFLSTGKRPERRSSSRERQGSPGAPEFPSQLLQAEEKRVEAITCSSKTSYRFKNLKVLNNKPSPVSKTLVLPAATRGQTGGGKQVITLCTKFTG